SAERGQADKTIDIQRVGRVSDADANPTIFFDHEPAAGAQDRRINLKVTFTAERGDGTTCQSGLDSQYRMSESWPDIPEVDAAGKNDIANRRAGTLDNEPRVFLFLGVI